MSLFNQLVASDALTIHRSPDFDHIQSIERLGEARSILLDSRGFAASFATVTLKSCAIYLQRTFPRILQSRYRTEGAIIGLTMDDASSVILDGLAGRAPSVLLVKGHAVCDIVEAQANLIAFVNFNSVENRGWPGEFDRAQLITTEPARFWALRAVIRDVLTLASHSPDVFSQPGTIESAEESILRVVDDGMPPGKVTKGGHAVTRDEAKASPKISKR